MKEGNEWRPRNDSWLSREEQDAAPWDLGGKGIRAVPEKIRKQMKADRAEYNRLVAEGYEKRASAGKYDKVSPGSADRANDRPAIEQREKTKVAEAYNSSLEAARRYNRGVTDATPGNLEYDSWKKPAGDIEVDSWKKSPGDIEVDSWRRAREDVAPPRPEAVPGSARVAANEAMPPAPRGAPAGAERIPPPLPLGPEGAAALRAAYGRGQEGMQNGERRSVWGWLKERGKGLLTLGFWEVHQAERFRSGTKTTAGEVAAQAELLDQTRDMDIEQAQDEANRIRAMAGGQQGMTREGIEAASNVIDREKAVSNARLMDRIVAQARENIQERLAKYRNEFGQHVVGDEQLAQFEQRLRTELEKAKIGRVVNDPTLDREINFKRAVRERLDPGYWHRYVYGALEAVAGYFTLQFAAAQLFSGPANAIPVPGGDQTLQMHDTIWKTSKEWIQQRLGVPNPTDAQIMRISKQVAIDNGIGVPVWGVPGNPLDTNMMQGYPLKFGSAALKAIAGSL